MKHLYSFRNALLGLIVLGMPGIQPLLGQSTAFGVDGHNFPTINLVSLPIPAATPVTTIGQTAANGTGGDFGPNGVFYTTQDFSLATVDISSGASTVIAPISGILPGEIISGMGYDASTGTMYLAATTLATSSLYTLNLSTGVLTVVGLISNAPQLLGIAVDCNGDMYGFDVAADNLISIDPATGAGTVVGPLGIDVGLVAQDADFDPVSGILYWTTFNNGSGELRSVNTSSGSSTLITTFSNDLTSFAIQGDCPPSGLEQGSTGAPAGYRLSQNYPNPFNPVTTIAFSIPKSGTVSLKVYDLRGREIAVLLNQALSAGNYEYQWDAAEFPSGTYFYRIEAGRFSETRKLTLLK